MSRRPRPQSHGAMLGAPWHGRVAQRPSSLVLVLRRFKRARKLAANEREVYHTSALVKIQKTLKSLCSTCC